MTQQIFESLEDLARLIEENRWQRLVLIADEAAFEQSGARARLESILSSLPTRYFTQFECNPKIAHVAEGAKLLCEEPDAAVVAIGGGSAIDTAKLACLLAAQHQPILQGGESAIETLRSPTCGRRNSLVAIPTTAGTGSEATEFAVVYSGETKHSVLHSSLLPSAVILDPTLTYSLPSRITAASGLDALSQAIESMWSVKSTDQSIDVAEQALRLGLANIEGAVLTPDPTNRAAMMRAAHLAGCAINTSHTTAPHALSYAMSIRHGVPHGMAVAISIGQFMRYNCHATQSTLVDPRGIEHHRHVMRRIAAAFGVVLESPSLIDEVTARWQCLLKAIGCPTRLAEWNVLSAAERRHLANAVNRERLANNPRSINPNDLQQIISEIG